MKILLLCLVLAGNTLAASSITITNAAGTQVCQLLGWSAGSVVAGTEIDVVIGDCVGAAPAGRQAVAWEQQNYQSDGGVLTVRVVRVPEDQDGAPLIVQWSASAGAFPRAGAVTWAAGDATPKAISLSIEATANVITLSLPNAPQATIAVMGGL